MITNYLKTVIRILLRNKVFSLISIIGLSIGLASVILIYMWINNQMEYDKSQINGDRLYRLEGEDWVNLPTKIANLVAPLPEVENVVRFNSWEEPLISYKDYSSKINHFIFTDSTVFNTFSFDFILGNPIDALNEPFTVVLTESFANKIFGHENPIGKQIEYDHKFKFRVTGVIKDVKKLHMNIQALASFESLNKIYDKPDYLDREIVWNFSTYVLLSKNTDFEVVEKKINLELAPQLKIFKKPFILRPFHKIYFSKGLNAESNCIHGNLQLIIVMALVAIGILILAGVNYINLTTARFSIRSKEISIKKVIGANRRQLIMQFIGESLTYMIISSILAMILIEFITPFFNVLLGEELVLDYTSVQMLGGIFGIIVIFSLIIGIYPALFFSSVNPLAIFKKEISLLRKNSLLRKSLVIIQFVISLVLIIFAFIIIKQLKFIQNKPLGFDIENVISFELTGEFLNLKTKDFFKQELLKKPMIKNVAYSGQVPGDQSNTNTWIVDGTEKPIIVIQADPAYVNFMGLKIVEGRNLHKESKEDINTKFIINQKAVQYLGLDSPIGKVVEADYGRSEIIGVIEDYHFNSLYEEILPIAIYWEPYAKSVNIRYQKGEEQEIIQTVQYLWKQLNPEFPFEYSILKKRFFDVYKAEYRILNLIIIFSLTAIFIAGMGVYGLSIFLAEQRNKEIGIRKIHGASIINILHLFSFELIKWVSISIVVASPLAYYFIEKWLQNFAYSTPISWWVFLFSALIILLISLITFSSQIIKTAMSNPLDCIKHE